MQVKQHILNWDESALFIYKLLLNKTCVFTGGSLNLSIVTLFSLKGHHLLRKLQKIQNTTTTKNILRAPRTDHITPFLHNFNGYLFIAKFSTNSSLFVMLYCLIPHANKKTNKQILQPTTKRLCSSSAQVHFPIFPKQS